MTKHDEKKQTEKDVTLPADDDPIKEDVVAYFGADGEDEGAKLMKNPDGTYGEEQNAAG
jgi:hypothetical protein